MRFRIEQVNGEWVAFSEDGQELGRAEQAWAVMRVVHAWTREHLAGLEAFQVEGDRAAWRSAPAIAFEETETRDGRLIVGGAARWESTPLPLMLLTETSEGHLQAELCGTIENLSRSSSEIRADGLFDRSDAGTRAVQVLEDHPTYGISIDLGEYDAEIECVEEDEDGFCTEIQFRFTDAEIMGATLCPFPAFADAAVELASGGSDSGEDDAEGSDGEATRQTANRSRADAALVAAAIPTAPPAEWFEPPNFGANGEVDARLQRVDDGGPWGCPMTVTDEGRIFGHFALWGTCHVGRPDECLPPPQSATDYAYFRTGELQPCETDCEPLPVGVVTLGTGHADPTLAAGDTIHHYDHTGTGVADVVVGEDEHGGWFAGALRPGVTEEQVRTLRASALSGDWRRIGGSLELVALLAVNVPGYPVPRARMQAGRQLALVAAGAPPLARMAGRSPSRDDVAELRRQVRQLEGDVSFLRDLADTPEERARVAAAYRERIEGGRPRTAIGSTPTT